MILSRLPSLALMGSGIRNQWAYLKTFILRNLFLIVILYVFISLWKKVYLDRFEIAGFDLCRMVWYLVVTEVVIFAKSDLWSTVQREVKDGTVAYGLVRPLPYPRIVMMRFLGEGVVRLVPVIIFGSLTARLTANEFPSGAAGVASGLILIVGALILMAQMEMLVGLAAFMMEDVTPLYWILQKIIFIFGGLYFPLDLYPTRFAAILKLLPFAHVAYWPGTVTVMNGTPFIRAVGGQLFWAAVLGLIILAVYRGSIRRIEVQGG